MANSRHYGKDEDGNDDYFDYLPIGTDGSKLIARSTRGTFGLNSTRVAEVASGTYDEVVGRWQRGVRAADQINRQNFDYKGHDPAYEFGGHGGEIQNSNSVAYTLGRVMNLDLDRALRETGSERKFSGRGRDLLDPQYRRYSAPPDLSECLGSVEYNPHSIDRDDVSRYVSLMDRHARPTAVRRAAIAAAIVLALAGIGSLSACAEKCPMGRGTALDLAAHYPEFTSGGYGLPLDTWTVNPGLASTVGDIVEWAQCLDFGEILMHVDIGPGRVVKAMTYWKSTPAAREN